MAERKFKNKSKVWAHYKKGTDPDKTCECLICGRKIRTSGNTTNLRSHLKTHNIDLRTDTDPDSRIKSNMKQEPERYNSKNVINIGQCQVEVLDDFLVLSPDTSFSQSEQKKEKSKDDPLFLQTTSNESLQDFNSNSGNQQENSDDDPLYEPENELEDQDLEEEKKKRKKNTNSFQKKKKQKFANKLIKFNNSNVNKSVIPKTENSFTNRESTIIVPRNRYYQEKDDFDRIGEIVANRLRELHKKFNARRCENEILTIILSYEIDEASS